MTPHVDGTTRRWHHTSMAPHVYGTTRRWHHTSMAPHVYGTTRRWHHTSMAPHVDGTTRRWHHTSMAPHVDDTHRVYSYTSVILASVSTLFWTGKCCHTNWWHRPALPLCPPVYPPCQPWQSNAFCTSQQIYPFRFSKTN